MRVAAHLWKNSRRDCLPLPTDRRTSLVANFLISDYRGPGADDAADFVFEIRFRSPLRLYIYIERTREREMEVITLII